MGQEGRDTPGDFAARLVLAMASENRSPTRTEREAGLQRGYMTQLKSGKIRSPGPETIRQLADYLRVSYEWLAIGRGPMRAEGWAPSPLEEARGFAGRHGVRVEAIDAAAERYRDATDMTAIDWVLAFDAEERRIGRAPSPSTEDVAKAQARLRRLKRQKRQGEERAAEAARRTPTRRGSAA